MPFVLCKLDTMRVTIMLFVTIKSTEIFVHSKDFLPPEINLRSKEERNISYRGHFLSFRLQMRDLSCLRGTKLMKIIIYTVS